VPIALPPLRERRNDLPLLAAHCIARFRKETGKPIAGLTADALSALLDYAWPGNVRELENAIEHAFVCCPGTEITLPHLPLEVRGAPRRLPPEGEARAPGPVASPPPAATPPGEASERERIVRALNEAG